jgi:hypothetical protein
MIKALAAYPGIDLWQETKSRDSLNFIPQIAGAKVIESCEFGAWRPKSPEL